MDMELGPEVKRQVILKYNARLHALLCEHEYQTDESEHLQLLNHLIKIVEDKTKDNS